MDRKLHIKGVSVTINGNKILQNIDLTLEKGEIVAVVGESGSGKTSLSKALMGILPSSGEVTIGGSPLCHKHVGRDITLVPQNSMNSFNPSIKMGKQLIDGVLLHKIDKGAEAKKNTLLLMEEFNLKREVYDNYPHELSGGMKQRMAFIMGILPNPDFLILDEVTTGLDTLNKGIILEKINKIKKSKGILLISHEIELVREVADRVIVLKNGVPVEWGPCSDVLTTPKHPYVEELINSLVENMSEGITPLKKLRTYRDNNSCSFIEHCPHAMNICTTDNSYISRERNRGVTCWKYYKKEERTDEYC